MKSSRPKVLLFSDWFAPGFKAGGPITSVLNMVKLLSDQVDFKIFTRNTDWFDKEPYQIESNAWIEKFHAHVYYSSSGHLFKILKEISISDKSTIIYFNGFYSPLFNAIPLLFCLLFKRSNKVILAPRGMLNSNAISLKSKRKVALIKLFRILNLERTALFHSTSNTETNSIKKQYRSAQIHQLTNIPNIESINFNTERDTNGFVSVGRISEVKNSLELIQLFSMQKGATLKLIGSADNLEYLFDCQKALSSNVSIIDGLKPTEIKTYLAKSRFFISMTSGENFGHAIIEAMSCGCPVILSDKTPWNDAESEGAGWVIGMNESDRWREIIELANALPKEEYSVMSARAKSYVKKKFDFDEIRESYLSMLHV